MAVCALQQSYGLCVCVYDCYQMPTEDVTSYIPRILHANFCHSCVQRNCAQPHLMPGKDSCPPNGICSRPWRHPPCLTTVDTPPSSTRSEGPKQLLASNPLIGAICPFVTTDTALSVVSYTHYYWTLDPKPLSLWIYHGSWHGVKKKAKERTLDPCSLPSCLCHTCRGRTPRVSRQNICKASINHTEQLRQFELNRWWMKRWWLYR